MGIKYRTFLDGYEKVYVCSKCKTHLTTNTMLLSKDFQGLYGKAYLFQQVVNIVESKRKQDTLMTTGRHCICYITCLGCDEQLGWKYLKAFDEDQVYKEGKFILEKHHLRMM